MTDHDPSLDFTALPDLAGERFGGSVVVANDEFFASRENLLKAAAPVWREGEYTARGKWMDGWETRRRREPGSDWCLIRLGLPGVIRGVVVDTAFFTGNYPEACSIEAANLSSLADESDLSRVRWTEVLSRSPLSGDRRTPFAVTSSERWTHLRFNIFPDGGVARLRVHGAVRADWDALLRPGGWVDLAALAHGGRVVAQSDQFYGDANKMLQPGRATHMGDGWETKRRRVPGNEWAVVRLARPGLVRRVELDTDHYKGNAPGWCSLDACASTDASLASATWRPVLDRTALHADARHAFEGELAAVDKATHLRLSIHPDGGVARLRLFGTPCPP